MTSRNDTKRVAGIGRVDCRTVLDLMDLRSVDVRNMPDSHYAAISRHCQRQPNFAPTNGSAAAPKRMSAMLELADPFILTIALQLPKSGRQQQHRSQLIWPIPVTVSSHMPGALRRAMVVHCCRNG